MLDYGLQGFFQSPYIDETKKKILPQAKEHQQDSLNKKQENSGAAEHTLACHGNLNWLHSKTIARETNYRETKISEALNKKQI